MCELDSRIVDYPSEFMAAWEEGLLDEHEEAHLFRYLIASGTIYCLQGCYGRRAQQLLGEGLTV